MEYHNPKIPELDSFSAVLTIELDPQSPDFDGVPPPPLSRADAARVADCIAADIAALSSDIRELTMVIPGALYDQTELLRPDFPLLRALENLFRGTLTHGGFTPQLIALGTEETGFPIAAIDPARRPGSGPLLILPFTFCGRKLRIATLASTLENTLLQHASVAQNTATAIQQAFALQAVNMTYATVNDLCALLKIQLENTGFEPLWTLLEHALFARPGCKRVSLPGGNSYLLSGDQVYTPYYTFDDWAQFGAGRDLDGEQLAAGYGIWVRAQRQYTVTLQAHGLTVIQVMSTPGIEHEDSEQALAAARSATELAGDCLLEVAYRAESEAAERHLLITNQFIAELGTVAYTVQSLDEQDRILTLEHHYPLNPGGLDAIIDQLVRRCDDFGSTRQVLHPRALVYSPTGRCLEAEDATGSQEPPRRH